MFKGGKVSGSKSIKKSHQHNVMVTTGVKETKVYLQKPWKEAIFTGDRALRAFDNSSVGKP